MPKKKVAAHHHSTHKEAVTRLRRAQGHLDAVIQMIETERSCAEILQQMTAVISALGGARTMLFKDHLRTCLMPALKVGHESLVEELEIVITRAMKTS